jgi:hypothetical protein
VAITLDDDAVLLDAGIRMKFIRDAEYSPAPPLVAMDGDQQTLLQCLPDGTLKVTASLSNVNVYPQVDMLGRDITNTQQFLQVETDPVTSRYALLVNDPRLTFTGMALNVVAGESVDLATQILKYDETASPIAGGGTGTVVSYTVPVGKTFRLRHASASGDNIAEFFVKVNGATVAKKRSWYTDYNAEFFFGPSDGGGYVAVAGDIVTIEVNNFGPNPGDFNGTIFGRTE